jgi:hypothetical protein
MSPSDSTHDGVETPPLDYVRRVLDRLAGARIPHALGGSALLASLGLAARVHDWDVTADADIDPLVELLRDFAGERFDSSGVHADHKLTLFGGEVEVIARFALRSDAGVFHVPLRVSGAWRGLPIASPEAWAVAYALMGRDAKAEALFECLARQGANAKAVEAILAQPLPEAIARRLDTLPITDAPDP